MGESGGCGGCGGGGGFGGCGGGLIFFGAMCAYGACRSSTSRRRERDAAERERKAREREMARNPTSRIKIPIGARQGSSFEIVLAGYVRLAESSRYISCESCSPFDLLPLIFMVTM